MEATEWSRLLTGLLFALAALIGIIGFLVKPLPSRFYGLQTAIFFTLFALAQFNLSLKLFIGIWAGAWVISLILAWWEGRFTHQNCPSWSTSLTIALMPFLLITYVLIAIRR